MDQTKRPDSQLYQNVINDIFENRYINLMKLEVDEEDCEYNIATSIFDKINKKFYTLK